jgi:hypothetical protein
VPVKLHGGKLIDGRHRLRAGVELGVDIPAEDIDILSTQAAIAAVIGLNVSRRHSSQSQLACIGARIKSMVATMKSEGVYVGTPQEAITPRDIAASMVGVSGRYVDMALQVESIDPELFRQVSEGAIPLTAAIKCLDDRQKPPDAEEDLRGPHAEDPDVYSRFEVAHLEERYDAIKAFGLRKTNVVEVCVWLERLITRERGDAVD